MFGLGVQSKAGQRLTELCQENMLVTENTLSSNGRDDSTREHHQRVSAKLRPTVSFAAKYREALYSQQKQEQGLTVAQIINSLLQNSDLN